MSSSFRGGEGSTEQRNIDGTSAEHRRNIDGTSTEHRLNIDGTTAEQKLNANGQMGLCVEGEGPGPEGQVRPGTRRSPGGWAGPGTGGRAGGPPTRQATAGPKPGRGQTHILH